MKQSYSEEAEYGWKILFFSFNKESKSPSGVWTDLVECVAWARDFSMEGDLRTPIVYYSQSVVNGDFK